MKEKIKTFFKENEFRAIGLIIFFIILFLVAIGETWLIESNLVSTFLFVCIIWIIILYIWKEAAEKKYNQLLHFAYKFYQKAKKTETHKYHYKDYTLGGLEEEFENWLIENRLNKKK